MNEARIEELENVVTDEGKLATDCGPEVTNGGYVVFIGATLLLLLGGGDGTLGSDQPTISSLNCPLFVALELH